MTHPYMTHPCRYELTLQLLARELPDFYTGALELYAEMSGSTNTTQASRRSMGAFRTEAEQMRHSTTKTSGGKSGCISSQVRFLFWGGTFLFFGGIFFLGLSSRYP